jgi:hypothetical protein
MKRNAKWSRRMEWKTRDGKHVVMQDGHVTVTDERGVSTPAERQGGGDAKG